jgi:PTS system cellobiose-specific IIB component
MKKILLACNAGMSTSLLVQKMKKEAAAKGLDVEIDASPLASALDKVADADILMLGPQISYARKEAEAAAGKVPVAVIAMADYGRMNASKILDDAFKIIGRD